MLPNVFQVITFPVVILVKNVIITLSSRCNDIFDLRELLLDTLNETDEPAANK
jgi:hypothetical protein